MMMTEDEIDYEYCKDGAEDGAEDDAEYEYDGGQEESKGEPKTDFEKYVTNKIDNFCEMFNIENKADGIFMLYTIGWNEANVIPICASAGANGATCDICFQNISDVLKCNTKYKCMNDCVENICKICYSTYFMKYFTQHKLPKKCICCRKSKCYTYDDYSYILNTKFSTYELKNTLEKYLMKDFLKTDIVWFNCINDTCKNIIKTDFSTNTCYCKDCKITFCGLCKKPAHTLVSCNENSSFLCEIEKIQMRYVGSSSLFKECPKCNCLIEKINNTCLKMKCKLCSYCFCWNCCEDYNTHTGDLGAGGFYTCNKISRTKKIHDVLVDDYILLTTYLAPGENKELFNQIIETLKQFIIFLNFNDQNYTFIKDNILIYYNYLSEIVKPHKSIETENKDKINKAIHIIMKSHILTEDFARGAKRVADSKLVFDSVTGANPNYILWYSPDLPLFPETISKQIQENLLLLNYEFTININENTYSINLKENIIVNIKTPYIHNILKVKYITDTNCPQCTYHNLAKYSLKTVCEICEYIY